MTLLAAWAVLLARLSGQQDVVIGTPTANRGRTEIENLIGFFVNTLALRLDLSGSPSGSVNCSTQAKDAGYRRSAASGYPFRAGGRDCSRCAAWLTVRCSRSCSHGRTQRTGHTSASGT